MADKTLSLVADDGSAVKLNYRDIGGGLYAAGPSLAGGTLLASAARTATTPSADQANVDARGVIAFLTTTVASGTGGLQVAFQAKDPLTGNYFQLNALPTAIVATGQKAYVLLPGAAEAASGDVGQNTQRPLPLGTWRVNVVHGDGSGYTYSVGFLYLR